MRSAWWRFCVVVCYTGGSEKRAEKLSFYVDSGRRQFDMRFSSRVVIVVVCGNDEGSKRAVENGVEFMQRSKRRCSSRISRWLLQEFYCRSGVVEGDARFRIGILHFCGLYATETNAAGDILYDEISFGGEMRKSVRTKCGCLLDSPKWLPEELRNCPMESLVDCYSQPHIRCCVVSVYMP